LQIIGKGLKTWGFYYLSEFAEQTMYPRILGLQQTLLLQHPFQDGQSTAAARLSVSAVHQENTPRPKVCGEMELKEKLGS
jgi:hypothetical protein